jgi:hypothetical protein
MAEKIADPGARGPDAGDDAPGLPGDDRAGNHGAASTARPWRRFDRARARRILPAAGLWALAAALLAWSGLAVVSPSYDPMYSLAWGQYLAEGSKPDLHHALAPLAHPLPIVFGVLLSPLGPAGAYDAFTMLGAFSFALLGFAAFRLARALVGTRELSRVALGAGVLVLLLLVTRARIDYFALKATVDIPFAALLLLACSYVVEDPRARPWLPLALLVPAGLLRPESWLIAAGYCAWLAYDGLRGRRLAICAALAAAPVAGWLAFAAIMTGDPLSPITGNPNAENVDVFGFVRPETASASSYWVSDAREILDAAVDRTRSMIGDELALLGFITVLWALLPLIKPENRTPQRLRLAAVAGFVVLLLVQAMVLAELGAPLSERYVIAPAIILIVLSSVAIWTIPRREVAIAVSALVVLLATTGALSRRTPVWPTLPSVRDRISQSHDEGIEQEQLYRLTTLDDVRAAVRPCNKVKIGGRGGIYAVLFAKPLIAHGLDRDPQKVAAERSPRGKLTASNFRRDLPLGPPPFLQEGVWVFRSPCLREGYVEGLITRREGGRGGKPSRAGTKAPPSRE